jgi:hypothetical protein
MRERDRDDDDGFGVCFCLRAQLGVCVYKKQRGCICRCMCSLVLLREVWVECVESGDRASSTMIVVMAERGRSRAQTNKKNMLREGRKEGRKVGRKVGRKGALRYRLDCRGERHEDNNSKKNLVEEKGDDGCSIRCPLPGMVV